MSGQAIILSLIVMLALHSFYGIRVFFLLLFVLPVVVIFPVTVVLIIIRNISSYLVGLFFLYTNAGIKMLSETKSEQE